MSDKDTVLRFTDQEVNTILAALRWYQASGMGQPDNRPDWLHDIATNDDAETSMDYKDINHLCERINWSGFAPDLQYDEEGQFTYNVMIVEFLSEGSVEGWRPISILENMDDGELVGYAHQLVPMRLSDEDTKRMLYEVGSDPSFFFFDEDDDE